MKIATDKEIQKGGEKYWINRKENVNSSKFIKGENFWGLYIIPKISSKNKKLDVLFLPESFIIVDIKSECVLVVK